MTEKIAAEVCEVEFKRLCVARRIDSDESSMTADELASFKATKAKIMRLLAAGSLVITPAPANLPIYTPVVPSDDESKPHKPLTFYKATGATMMAQDGFGPFENVARVVAVATEMTKSETGAISRLDIEDVRAVNDITNFFFTR
jgi:hypothetical protein